MKELMMVGPVVMLFTAVFFNDAVVAFGSLLVLAFMMVLAIRRMR